MATYTTNYNLEKPAQTDIYNVDVFNANADKIDAGLTDKAEKTMLAPVETTNSASRSYAKGEYFVYNNVLCCATTAIAAGGTIAIGTNCSTAPVGGELKSLRESLTYKSGDTIVIPSTRYTAFGNFGGTVFVVPLYMPKMFTTQRQFTISGSPYNYSGEIRVGGVNKASSTIYFTQFANTNIVNLNVDVQTGTGGSMEHAVWVPSGPITITLP